MSLSGRFVWRELYSPDLAASRSFYGALLGWISREVPMGMPDPYVLFRHGSLDEDTGGLLKPPMPEAPPCWVAYVTVDDVDQGLAQVSALGGRKLSDAMDIPGVGRFAMAMDPQGGAFALFKGLSPGATDTQRVPPDGTFCWSQLMTANLDGAVAFYTRLLGWTVQPMGPGTVVFMDGECMRGSAMQKPPEAAGGPDAWLNYVAVPDCDAAWDKALALGARGFMGPTTMEGMGRFAVLADPQGAVFALWKDLSPRA